MSSSTKSSSHASKKSGRRGKSVSYKIMLSIMGVLIPFLAILIIMSCVTADRGISALNGKLMNAQADHAVSIVDDFFRNKISVVGMFKDNGNFRRYFETIDTKQDIESSEDSAIVVRELAGAQENMAEENVIQTWVADESSDCYLLSSGQVVEAGLKDTEWFPRVMEEKEKLISEPYVDPATGERVVSAVAPVFAEDGTTIIGVVGFDIYESSLTKLLEDIKVGENGYLELLSNNSDYIYSDDPAATGKNVEELDITDDYKQKVLDNYTGVVNFKYGNEKYTSVFMQSATTKWLAIATLPMSEVQATSSRLILFMIVLSFVILAAVVLVISAIVRKTIKPLGQIGGTMEAFSQGDLNVEIDIHRDDEIGWLADSIRASIDTLKGTIQDAIKILGRISDGDLNVSVDGEYVGDFVNIKDALDKIIQSLNFTIRQINISSEQVSVGSEQVSAGAQSLAQGASEQAGTVEELADSIGDISEQVSNNAKNAENASDRAKAVGTEIEESNQRMGKLLEAMNDIRKSSREISNIIKTIEDIAFQTNILSLNASVEAARAGEAGRGFSVVANEVRNLASKSAKASKETSELIEKSLRAVENGAKIADETAQSLEQVVEGVKEVAGAVGGISEASREQAFSVEQVTRGIEQISNVVQANSATAEESAAASEELSAQAELLKELIGKFQIKDER